MQLSSITRALRSYSQTISYIATSIIKIILYFNTPLYAIISLLCKLVLVREAFSSAFNVLLILSISSLKFFSLVFLKFFLIKFLFTILTMLIITFSSFLIIIVFITRIFIAIFYTKTIKLINKVIAFFNNKYYT